MGKGRLNIGLDTIFFDAIGKKMNVAEQVSVISEFFAFVDKDADGFISVEEIKDACAVDINGDGVVSEDEKMQCARVWINEKLPLQDLNADQKISLEELMAYALQ